MRVFSLTIPPLAAEVFFAQSGKEFLTHWL
jgi:hypothetical protein